MSLTQEEFEQSAAASEGREVPTPGAPALGNGVEECWMDVDGARMRYLRAGSGPPIVLLHGLLGYSFSWRYALPALAPLAYLLCAGHAGGWIFRASEHRSFDAGDRSAAAEIRRALET